MKENEGMLVSDDAGVYFIPKSKLSDFRLSEAESERISEALADDDEVAGFGRRDMKRVEKPNLSKEFEMLKFGFSGPLKPGFGSMMGDNPDIAPSV